MIALIVSIKEIKINFIFININSVNSLGKNPSKGGIPPIFSMTVYSIIFFSFNIIVDLLRVLICDIFIWLIVISSDSVYIKK